MKKVSVKAWLVAATLPLIAGCGGSSPGGSGGSSSLALSVSPSTDIRKDSDSGLIEIGGQCAADGQSVKVGGQVVGHSERPCQGGAFMLCTLLPSLGNNAIELTQLNAQGQQLHANYDVFEEHPVQSTIDL
ncbi:MAG: hypothetical protein AB7F86_05465, partial [Bdellovibrionales bacterium]